MVHWKTLSVRGPTAFGIMLLASFISCLFAGVLRRSDSSFISSRASAALESVQESGPTAQTTPVTADIWSLLRPLARGGQPIYMQWVCSHCGLPGNERADILAGEACALPQDSIPIDVGPVQQAVERVATHTWQQGWPDGWYKSAMQDKLPGPVGVGHRTTAVDVH